jgi:hypothetical protein
MLYLAVSILGGGIGGFTHIFENSPLFFQRQGENFKKRKKGKDQQM